jgi:hypothetical protein
MGELKTVDVAKPDNAIKPRQSKFATGVLPKALPRCYYARAGQALPA